MNKLCIACGVEFIQKRKDQVSCGKKCSKKAWKIQNWDYVLEQQRIWFKKKRIENPEKYRWYTKHRRHLLREVSGSSKNFSKSFSLKEWEDMKHAYNYTCPYCNKSEPEIKLTIDHIYPLSKGGNHCKENIQPLCHGCNSGKKDKIGFNPIRNIGQMITV